MVKCCLWSDALGRFLAWRARVDLIAVVLARPVRTQWLNAPDVGQNDDTPGMPAVARYTDAGCSLMKS